MLEQRHHVITILNINDPYYCILDPRIQLTHSSRSMTVICHVFHHRLHDHFKHQSILSFACNVNTVIPGGSSDTVSMFIERKTMGDFFSGMTFGDQPEMGMAVVGGSVDSETLD